VNGNSRPAPSLDLIAAVGRGRTVLVSGALAGVCVFFTPLLILALGLLGAYLADVVSDGEIAIFHLARPLTSDDFRAVFAPAVNEAPLLVSAGLLGGALAQFRRHQARRSDPGLLAAGIRPFFPEFLLLYVLMTGLALGLALTHGGMPQVRRLVLWAPIFLPFLLCVTWLAHSVWSYCFRNVLDLLATAADRDAASELRGRSRAARPAR
jgi:hypothetical protein